jgi:hypothetical protein
MGAQMNRLVIALVATTSFVTQQATFRTTTHRVAVDVSVLAGNNPVVGLTSADFTLTDNGVRQTIEAVALGDVPVDVSLVVDVSGSTIAQLDAYRRDVRSIAALLRPIDRLRVVAFETSVREPVSLGSHRVSCRSPWTADSRRRSMTASRPHSCDSPPPGAGT